MKLTNTTIRAAKPTSVQQKLFDGKGLFLLVSPTGSKIWRFKYQFQGREKLLSLVQYPDVSLKDARAKVADARKILANGGDPSATRKAAIQQLSSTFELVAREWFKKQTAAWQDHYAAKMKMSRDHIVPLSKQAVAILEEMRPFSGDGQYVFPGRNRGSLYLNINTLADALRALGYSKDEMCAHGFRAMGSTLLNEQG